MTGTTLVLDRGYAHDLRLRMPASPLEEYDKLVRNSLFPRKPRKYKALQRGRHRHAPYLYADQPSCGAVARQAQPWRRLLDRRANDTTFGSDLGSGCRWLFAPDGP